MINTMHLVLLALASINLPARSLASLVFQNPEGSIFESTPDSGADPPLTYIPPIGLGLWQSKGTDATNAVKYALDAGYRHIDSAAAYGNEEYVGLGLNHTLLPRTAYWITSKLWNVDHAPAKVEPAIRKTLAQLNTTYLDLYLMHWPVAQTADPHGKLKYDNETSVLATWHAMESLLRKGLTKNIGISNFAPADVDAVMRHCKAGGVCPVAHEFETHPYLQQSAFVDYHRELGIQVIAYSPLANINPIYDSKLPPILQDTFWVELAKKKGVTVAQAILAWGVQRGTVVIPKSVHEARIIENFGANMVRFDEKEMKLVAMQDKKARFNNPSKSWGVKLFQGLD